MTATDLSIIIVSWNVRDLLRACLASLAAGAAASAEGPLLTVEVIVVDNASADGSAAMVAAEFPAVQLIANQENRGFTGGNNQGLALARGRYVLFLNPDTVVSPGAALSTMVAYMEAHPKVGALGPRLRYGDGSLQSSAPFPHGDDCTVRKHPWPGTGRTTSGRAYRMEDGGLQVPGYKLKVDKFQPSTFQPATHVDWVVGAALLTRRAVLDEIGGFDEGYFMYSEELDWCRRAALAGWQTVYLPTAEIIHYEGKSSEQVVAARHIRFHRSRVRYFRKFHGRAAAETVRLVVLGMFAVEWLLEAGKWLLGSRALRRERLAAYRQLLKSGLRRPPACARRPACADSL